MTTKTNTKPSYKPGQKVSHATYGAGKIEHINHTQKGIWLAVNFGDKKKPNVKCVRPGTVSKA